MAAEQLQVPNIKFTINITSEIGELKQTTQSNIEVKNNTQGLIVQCKQCGMDGDKNYVWVLEKELPRKQVTLGNADAENQEISSGLTKDSKVIINQTDSLKEQSRRWNLMKKLIQVKNINKNYHQWNKELQVLKDIQSGGWKKGRYLRHHGTVWIRSTLSNIIGMDRPTTEWIPSGSERSR